MDPLLGSALIGAGSSLVSSLLGGGNNHAGRDQRQAISFANRSAITDKVAAAKEAGISPLYALGAPVISTTSQVGDTGSSLGSTIASMGADVSRAVAASQSDVERKIQALTLDKAALENDYLREQIASVRARTAREAGPAYPVIPVTSNPLPGMNGVSLGVQYPGLGNKAENDYSDIGGNIFGGAALVNDTVRDLEAWFRSNFPSMKGYERYLPFNLYK